LQKASSPSNHRDTQCLCLPRSTSERPEWARMGSVENRQGAPGRGAHIQSRLRPGQIAHPIQSFKARLTRPSAPHPLPSPRKPMRPQLQPEPSALAPSPAAPSFPKYAPGRPAIASARKLLQPNEPKPRPRSNPLSPTSTSPMRARTAPPRHSPLPRKCANEPTNNPPSRPGTRALTPLPWAIHPPWGAWLSHGPSLTAPAPIR
jgi:hypothetical protein